MQKLIYKGLCCLWGGLIVWAVMPLPAYADDTDNNAVRMVTYFPVPYARYNNIYVTDKLDIGTEAREFELQVGTRNANAGAKNESFKANNVNLRNITDASILQIGQDFRTDEAVVGNDSVKGTATLQFANLFVEAVNAAGSGTTGSINELHTSNFANTSSSGKLKFFDNQFPSGCSEQGLAWQELTFQSGSTAKYLVCCDQSTATTASNDACRQSCLGFDTSIATCKGENASLLEGQVTHNGSKVAGSWVDSGGFADGSCYCDCSSVVYTASKHHGAGQVVTGGVRRTSGVASSDPYDYCQEKCYSNYKAGNVDACENSTWKGESIGAQWNYNTCSCNCKATSSEFISSGTYGCTHQCYVDYNDNRPSTCESSVSGATWNDSNCTCDCGDYAIYKNTSGNKSCENRCVSGNPIWGSRVDNCNSTKGNGSGWNSNTCKCDCGTKEVDGKTRILLEKADGSCA